MTDFGKAKGSNLLKNVALKNQDMDSKSDLVIKELPCDQLNDNPDNEYLFGMEKDDIEHMAEGIRENGFQGVVEVFSDGKSYELYSGHIRKYGAMKAGLTKVPAIVKPMPEETVKRRLLLGANLYGRNKISSSNPILTGRQLEYHKETLTKEGFKGNVRAQLSKEFGISEAQVHRYMALLSLSDDLQEIAAAGLVPFTLLSEAKGLSEKDQADLYNRINDVSYNLHNGNEPLTSREFKAILDDLRKDDTLDGQMELKDYEEKTSNSDPAFTTDDSEECSDCYLNEKSCHPEIGEHECYLDDPEEDPFDKEEAEALMEDLVRDEQLREPDKKNVREPYPKLCLQAYKDLIRDEVFSSMNELREYLSKTFRHTYHGSSDFSYQGSVRGIKINSFDEITWRRFLERVAEADVTVLLFDTDSKKSETKAVSEIERMIYRTESQISQGAFSGVSWSNPKEACKIMRSLIAMLEDEIDSIAG